MPRRFAQSGRFESIWIGSNLDSKEFARTIGFKSLSNRFESLSEEENKTKAMDSNPHKKDSISFEKLSSTSENERNQI